MEFLVFRTINQLLTVLLFLVAMLIVLLFLVAIRFLVARTSSVPQICSERATRRQKNPPHVSTRGHITFRVLRVLENSKEKILFLSPEPRIRTIVKKNATHVSPGSSTFGTFWSAIGIWRSSRELINFITCFLREIDETCCAPGVRRFWWHVECTSVGLF